MLDRCDETWITIFIENHKRTPHKIRIPEINKYPWCNPRRNNNGDAQCLQ